METSAQRRKRRGRTPPPPTRPGTPFLTLFRMFGIGAISVIVSVYALIRHYTVPRAPLLVPVPPPSAQPAGEVELEGLDTLPGAPASASAAAAPAGSASAPAPLERR